MIRGRSVALVGSTLVVAAAFGCAGARGVTVRSEAMRPVSPCGTATAPAWSPDGRQIAWYGFRWPLPPNHHAVGSYNILRSICISDVDGKNLHRLPGTACSEFCPDAFGDPPGRLAWVEPDLLLAGNDLGIFTVPVGGKAELLGKTGPVPFSVDANGDRVAAGPLEDCSGCSGPVKILSVPSGAVVGVVGGTKLDNSEPSLSPDGKQVVFTRSPAGYSGRTPGIWIAAVDGSHLRRLEARGDNPLWSPAGDRIAYLAPTGAARSAWRLVAPQGGSSTTLLRDGTGTVFGWSPNGRWIAFPDSKGRLVVVDVATKKVRTLLKLRLPYGASSVVWSPDSRQLLVVWRPPAHSTCPTGLWRVPIDGAKPRLVHGC
jgi:Tol biopolymer transport system component